MAPRSISINVILAPGEAERLRKEFGSDQPQFVATANVSGGYVPEETFAAAAPRPFDVLHKAIDQALSDYLNNRGSWEEIEPRLRAAFEQAFGWPLGSDGYVPLVDYGVRQQLEYALQRRIDRHWWRHSEGVRDNWAEEEKTHTQAAVAWIWFDENFYLVPKDPTAIAQAGSWGCYRVLFEQSGYRVTHMTDVPGADRGKPPAFVFAEDGTIDYVDVWALNPRGADTAAHELLRWIRAHAPSLEAEPVNQSDFEAMKTPAEEGRVPGGC